MVHLKFIIRVNKGFEGKSGRQWFVMLLACCYPTITSSRYCLWKEEFAVSGSLGCKRIRAVIPPPTPLGTAVWKEEFAMPGRLGWGNTPI